MNWTFTQYLLTSNTDFLLFFLEFSFIIICLQGFAQHIMQWAATEFLWLVDYGSENVIL